MIETINTADPLSFGFRVAEATLRFLHRYHQHRVVGFEHLPRKGPALVAVNHSLATYDGFLMAVPALDELGRLFRGLADRQIFRTPGLGSLFSSAGFVNGTREATVELLQQGEIVGLAPGGMREALRPSRQKYTFDWSGRYGFIWVSLLSGAPIVLGACPHADDIFDVYDNPITPAVYDRVHLPLALFRGRGLTPVPRPIQLTHHLSEPIWPEVAPDRVTQADVEQHHARVVARMTQLMQEAL
jgi:1-acyl-sn-glycerol-3-phosphate acyltransferase